MVRADKTLMAREIQEIPDVIQRQLDQGRRVAAADPRGFLTCARGTSDHAATYFKYLIETRCGLPVASIGPSVASVYQADLTLEGFASVAISQSGGDPDLQALHFR